MFIRCSIFFLSLLTAQSISGQSPLIRDDKIYQHVYKGFGSLYSFDFRQAEREATELSRSRAESPWGNILKANIIWWKLMSGEEDGANRRLYLNELDEAEQKMERREEPADLFAAVLISSLRSRYYLYRKDYLNLFNELIASREMIDEMEEHDRQHETFLLPQGLFQYFLAEARERTGVLSPLYLLPYKASKEKGLSYLGELTHSKDLILCTEANYFLMKIYLETEDNPANASFHSHWLVSSYPENMIYQYYDSLIRRRLQPLLPDVSEAAGLVRRLDANPSLTVRQRAYLKKLMLTR